MKRFCAVVVILVVAGCKTTPPVTLPPTQTLGQIPPAVDANDLSTLRGRRICLDPGHGGPWPGAIAPSNGLREADVNLNVAHKLKYFLEQAGATVTMTREDDRALFPDSLPSDLAARVNVANQSQVDAFLSIHHNADIEMGSEKNDLEVYYKLREEGASLDLAQALTRALARELAARATAKLLLPGNYKVLRLAEVPAVLLESSYLTQGANAATLATEEAATAEARAIASGLANYFALDPPQLASAECVAVDGARSYELRVRFARGLPVDTTTAVVTLDDSLVPGTPEPAEAGFVWTIPQTLANGDHAIHMAIRNSRGAALEFPVSLSVNRPPANIRVTQVPAQIFARSESEILLEALVSDALGMPVADGTPVRIDQTGGIVATQNGRARFYIGEPGKTRELSFTSGAVVTPFAIGFGDARFRSLRVKSALSGAPVPGAVVMDGTQTLGTTTAEGWFTVPVSVPAVNVRSAGYEPTQIDLKRERTEILLNPVAGGVLVGKTIVIDPADGGHEPGTVSPDGTRASDLALDVARRAAALLREAGAAVHVTRPGDIEKSELQRVLTSEELGADLLVSIAFGATNAKTLDTSGYRRDFAAFVGHYPQSAEGMRLARAIGEALGGIAAVPSVAYVVQQSGCPAVLVQPANIADGENAARFRAPAARNLVAYNIYRGIVAYCREKGGSAP